MRPGPVLAVATRSGRDEVLHTGHAVVLDADGRLVESWGDPRAGTYWRSAAKPLQALPLATVAEDLGLSGRHVAVACGSHAGERPHVEAVGEILRASGLDASHLRCGTHAPWSRHSAFDRESASAIHNNCSGKHAGMLAFASHRGWDLPSYQEARHPLQRHLRGLIQDATGATRVPFGVDGCGVPTFYLSLVHLARTMQWLQEGHPTVIEAMRSHPFMVAGTDQFDTEIVVASKGQVVAKYGALGVQVVLHRSGAAFALRLTGGDPGATKAVAAGMAARLGWVKDGTLAPKPVRSNTGLDVGRIELRL